MLSTSIGENSKLEDKNKPSYTSPDRTYTEWKHGKFSAITEDGTIIQWGWGGQEEVLALEAYTNEDSNNKEIYSAESAFALLRSDGSVLSWGEKIGEDDVHISLENDKILDISSGTWGFAGSTESGGVYSWGNGYNEYILHQDVDKIFSASSSFSALLDDGRIYTWGSHVNDGFVENNNNIAVDLVSTPNAFLALNEDGSVKSWGAGHAFDYTSIETAFGSGNEKIYATQSGFASIKQDGSIISYGSYAERKENGAFEYMEGIIYDDSQTKETTKALEIASTYNSFAALYEDGTVESWGDLRHGNWGADTNNVSSFLINTTDIYSNGYSFVALRDDGSIVSWGGEFAGGEEFNSPSDLDARVESVHSSYSAFAALLEDGSVIAWGDKSAGGDISHLQGIGFELKNVNNVYTADGGFTAKKEDGSYVTWGHGIPDDPASIRQMNEFINSYGKLIISDIYNSEKPLTISDEEDVLNLNYSVWGIDENFLGFPAPPAKEVKKQIAVLGDSVDHEARYDLNITADILNNYMIESADITIGFDAQLFNNINASDITVGSNFPIANAVEINNDLGTIRLAAATLSQLALNGDDISGDTVLASISLDFDEQALAGIAKNADGSLVTNPLAFTIDANLDETVFSSQLEDGYGFENRKIQTLRDLGGTITVDGQDVTLYEAQINLQQQGDGLVLGTQREIGSDRAFTNLVRSGDTLTTSADWLNVGNIRANNIVVQALSNANATLSSSFITQNSLNSGSFIDGVFVEDGREDLTLTADIHITGQAGNVLDLSDGILSIQADGSKVFSNAGQGSSNLITFQGDLNYDGRVSMKDLAYLNAGAARQQLSLVDVVPDPGDKDGNGIIDASVARDVDADFNGKIDLADLAVLDNDWGKTLHTGDEQFQGSADVSWNELDAQGDAAGWDNSTFKDQNAIESDPAYIGSLESPTTTGGIGADGNTTANDNDITGTNFQDPIPA